MNVRITHEARADLGRIWLYTARNWGERQADIYIDLLMLRIRWLTENHGPWIPRPDIRDGLYFYPEQSHAIFFTRHASHIDVLRLLHERMEPQPRLG